IHLSAELGHFLIGVVSKYVARDIHYGTKACFVNGNNPLGAGGQRFNISECIVANNETICATVKSQDGASACHWDWTGLGGEYQFLAGPSFMAMFTIASILWGILADKYDRVYILFSSSLLFSLALVFTSVSTRFWHLVVFRMMLAVGVAGVAPIAPGIIFDMFDSSERAMAMGFFHWGIYLGNGLTFVVGKYITEANLFNAGWRSTFVLTGLPGALLAILVLFTVDDPPKSHKSERQLTKNGSSKKHGNTYRHHHHHGLETESPEDDAEATEDCCESVDEAQVLISGGGSCQNKTVSSTTGAVSCCLQPAVIFLGLAACLRHSAGYTWGYNSALYFQTYFPNYSSASIWLTWITIGGGSLGVILGGYVSDRLVSRLGISSRALVLAGSQIIATPFALGLLYLKPPYAFMSLFIGYLFAEMWYGVVFAILVELLPASFRSLGLAISLFVVNNVGGNLPIIVTPLTNLVGFRGALTILYPGALFTSSILFFFTYVALLRK
ncbi:Protein spinster 2, partial [Orchesella cincta]